MRTTDFKQSPYTQRVRIKADKLEYLKRQKGKKSIAGKLDEIINFYIKENKDGKK